jgi:hypothetical protein
LAPPGERTTVSSEPPERPPAANLIAALPLRRNGAVGLATGLAFGGTVYAVRLLEVLGPAPDRGSPLLFLALAFVLASATAGLVFSVLTAVSAYRVLAAEPAGTTE